jgi:uncharacterized protein YqgC (DUF456 family)
MEIIIFIFLLALLLVGLLGVFIPILPGIPFMFCAVLVYGIVDKFGHISGNELIIFGVMALISLFIDYLAGALGAKMFGASGKGTLGGIIGSIVGLILFPPLGVFIGLALGVLIAEFVFAKKNLKTSTKITTGALLGALAGIILNLIIGLTFIITFIISFWK